MTEKALTEQLNTTIQEHFPQFQQEFLHYHFMSNLIGLIAFSCFLIIFVVSAILCGTSKYNYNNKIHDFFWKNGDVTIYSFILLLIFGILTMFALVAIPASCMHLYEITHFPSVYITEYLLQ